MVNRLRCSREEPLLPRGEAEAQVVTGNVGQGVRRGSQGRHRFKRNFRENTDVLSVDLDSLSIASSGRPPHNLSGCKKLSLSRQDRSPRRGVEEVEEGGRRRLRSGA